MKGQFIATAQALVPACDEARRIVAKAKAGQRVDCDVSFPRNVRFHRKFFAMVDHAFGCWEPEGLKYKGEVVQKSSERFRHDLIILAGYYEPVFNARGETRLVAKSISFGRMSEDEFEEVYSRVADVILQKILTKYTRDDLDIVVEQMMGFV